MTTNRTTAASPSTANQPATNQPATNQPATNQPATSGFPAGPAPRTAADRFFAAVRQYGAVRATEHGPRRRVAGVAGALAERWGIAPWVLRGAFVVLTLAGGIGLGLYGLGWALLPDARGRLEAEAAHRGDVSPTFVLVVALIVVDLLLGHGLLGFAGV